MSTDAPKTGNYQNMLKRNTTKYDPDFYETPPWITRALVNFLHAKGIGLGQIWEPGCGRMKMVQTLQEFGYQVLASDKHATDYGHDASLNIDFIDPAAPPAEDSVDWVVTNPPFGFATYPVEAKNGKMKNKRFYRPDEFMLNALRAAKAGVAILVRTNQVAGVERLKNIYTPYPPTYFIQFPERLNFHKGAARKGNGGGMVDFGWMVWVNPASYPTAALPPQTELAWFAHNTQELLEQEGDYPPLTEEELAAIAANKAKKAAAAKAKREARKAAKTEKAEEKG